MLASLLQLVFRILLGPAPVAPTEAAMDEFEAAEERLGSYGQYPSPLDIFEWDTEGREKRIAMGVLFCLTWRISVLKLPAWCGYTSGKTSGIRFRRQPFMRLNPYRHRTWFGTRIPF